MAAYGSFSGIITRIDDFGSGSHEMSGCNKLMIVRNGDGSTVNFVVTPTTYFVDHVMMNKGDRATGFYDTDAPVILIYPPQYQAIVMARLARGQNVAVDYFNEQLVSTNGNLKLNIAPGTKITLENGQSFTGSLANRYLIVMYGPTTRSIPAQTTPYSIVVMCPRT